MEGGSRAIRFLLFTDNPSFKKDLTKRINRLRFGYEILHFDRFQNLDVEISAYDVGLFEDEFILPQLKLRFSYLPILKGSCHSQFMKVKVLSALFLSQ